MSKFPPILFILTGGTIDSYYDGTKDTVVPNKKSIIPKFIQNMKLYNKTNFIQLCLKDSRDITKNDLNKILKKIESSSCKHIIITHGTYTVSDSARFLKANLKRKDQTIILTASMLPIAGFTMSDGEFNLGYAIAKAQDLPKGIYVCMNGRIFSPTEVMKVINQGRFASIFGEK